MNENPLVSIIVRTKDRPKLLKKALHSISEQTHRPVEVVLVNDGGCDLDIEELKTILTDVSLNYVRLEKNEGRARAGNAGIANAKGSYIGFLDDDDEFYPEHIATLVSALEQSGYRIAYADSLMVYKKYDPDTYELLDTKKEVLFSQDFDYDKLVFENYIPFMCLLFDREVLINSGGFDTDFDLYEDWDLLIRLGENNFFYHLSKITANYNQWNADFQISQGDKDQKLLRRSYTKIISKHIDRLTPDRIHDYMTAYVRTRNMVKEKESILKSLSADLRKKEGLIDTLKADVMEKDALKAELEDMKVLLNNKAALINDNVALINAMRSTLGWRVLEKYRRLRNRIMVVPASGGIKDSLIIKGLKVLKDRGFRAAIGKANKKLLLKKSVKRTFKSIPISSPSSSAIDKIIAADPLASKVSVVIPTKNAGEEFDYVLRKITQQEGIGEIEVIIVDSGSEDRTIDISRGYTKKIFQIPPEDFNHAGTRNFGAEKATGEFLVFTVQDAIPAGNQWLFKLLYPIYRGQSSASSARQIPRSDADLFSSWSYWSHNIKYLGCDDDCISNNSLFKDFDSLDLQAKRSMAKLDSVSLGIRKSVFDAYQFVSDYAEDLELGVRLIKNGHTLAFQSSNAVIHSHNRPALYFLRRNYRDTVTLWNILQIKRKALPAHSILETLSYLYSGMKICISSVRRDGWSLRKPSDVVDALIYRLAHGISRIDPAGHSLEGDHMVDEFFREIRPIHHEKMVEELSTEFRSILKSFSDFVANYPLVSDIEKDFLNSLYKLFCLTAGYYLGANSADEVSSLQGDI